MRHSPRRSLTLIELVIVLLILAALAGILVPQFGNLTVASHGSVGANNIQEIAKAIQLHRVKTGNNPDGLDSLLTGTALSPLIQGTALATAPNPATSLLTTLTLDNDPANDTLGALTAAGITNVYNFIANAEHPTFNPYSATPLVAAPASVPLADGTTVAAVPLAAVQAVFGGQYATGSTFAVFGIGQFCSMVGRTFTEAPVHTPENNNIASGYNRFLLVVQLTEGTNALEVARIIGVAALEEDGNLSGLNKHLAEYSEATNQ